MNHPEYQNEQLYSECKLVSIWNAARFWGLERLVPKIGTRRYKEICKKAKCIHGSALETKFERERLGLEYFDLQWDVYWVAKYLPCAMAVHCERGFHSVLAVAYKKGKPRKTWTDQFLVANWRKQTEWISWGEILSCGHLQWTPRLIAPARMVENLKACGKNHLMP